MIYSPIDIFHRHCLSSCLCNLATSDSIVVYYFEGAVLSRGRLWSVDDVLFLFPRLGVFCSMDLRAEDCIQYSRWRSRLGRGYMHNSDAWLPAFKLFVSWESYQTSARFERTLKTCRANFQLIKKFLSRYMDLEMMSKHSVADRHALALRDLSRSGCALLSAKLLRYGSIWALFVHRASVGAIRYRGFSRLQAFRELVWSRLNLASERILRISRY